MARRFCSSEGGRSPPPSYAPARLSVTPIFSAACLRAPLSISRIISTTPAESGHPLDGIAHAVRAELGPALAPQVVGREGAVDHLEHLRQLLGPLRDLAVVLARAEDVVALVAALLHAALDLPGRPERDADLRHHEADGALRACHRGHDRIGPAILGGDHVAVGAQVTKRELRRPRG